MKWIGQHIYDFVSIFRNEGRFERRNNDGLLFRSRTTTINGDEINLFNSANTSGPLIDIRNTGDNNTGATIDYYNLRANPADNDKILLSRYIANNDNGDAHIVGQQLWKFADVSDGAEKGHYALSLAAHNSAGSSNFFEAEAKGSSDIDVKIALGSSSTTTIRGDLTVSGGDISLSGTGRIQGVDTVTDATDAASKAYVDAAISGTVGAAVDLTSEVSGILPVANGGTGASSLTDNKLLTGTGTSAVTAEANATYDGTDLTLTSATSTKPILSIENTTHDANAGELRLIGRRSADASVIAGAGDDAGTISFVGENAKTGPDPETITYGRVVSESSVVTDGGEMGKMTMSVGHNASAIGGSLGFLDFMSSTASVFGETTTYGSGSLLSVTTFNSTITDFQSASSTGPIMSIRNYTNDATGGSMTFINSRGGSSLNAPNVNGDDLGTIRFAGFDSNAASAAGVTTTFAQILGEANEITNGSEEGKLTLSVASHDAELQPGLMMVSGNAEDEVDVTIGNVTTSVTTIAGTLTMGSTAAMTNAGQLSVAAQPNITTMTGFLGGTANALITDDGDGTITSEANATYDGDDLTLTSSTADKPVLSLISTNTASDSNPSLKFIKDAANVADGEFLGEILFIGDNDAGTPEQIDYARIWSRIADMTDGAEEGTLYLGVASHDGEMNPGVSITSGNLEDEVDVTVGNGASSLVTVPGKLSIGARIDFDSVGITGIQTAAESFSDDDVSLMTSAAIDDRINAAAGASPASVSSGSQTSIGIQIARRTITQGEANSMHSTPIEIVPAQGANTVIIPLGGMIRIDRATTQSSSSTDWNMHYADQEPGNYLTASIHHIRRFMYNEAGDRIYHITPGLAATEVAQNLTDDVNKAVEVSFDSAATTNAFTSIDVYLTYQVISIA